MENQEFKNHDLYISSVLLASGLPLKRLERNDRIMVFVFSDSDSKAQEIISNHWNRNNKIPSRDLVEAINELKTRIHSGI